MVSKSLSIKNTVTKWKQTLKVTEKSLRNKKESLKDLLIKEQRGCLDWYWWWKGWVVKVKEWIKWKRNAACSVQLSKWVEWNWKSNHTAV